MLAHGWQADWPWAHRLCKAWSYAALDVVLRQPQTIAPVLQQEDACGQKARALACQQHKQVQCQARTGKGMRGPAQRRRRCASHGLAAR